MNESDKTLAEQIKTEMAEFGAVHGACSKKLAFWARWAKPASTALGLLGGTSGTMSLLSAFVRDDDNDGAWSFQMGWPQIISVTQSALLVLGACITAQDFELRSIRHNDTAGDCAELVNDITDILGDTRTDEHDIIKAMAGFKAKKTEIQQSAPHL